MLPLEKVQEKLQEVMLIFPWYKNLPGVHQPNVTLQDLPLMSAEILEAHYYNRTPDPALAVYRTSGTSSGRRKSIFYSEEDDRSYVAIKTKLFGELIAGSGCTKAVADMGTGHAASTALDIFEQLGLEGRAIPFELPVEEHIEQLLSFQPDLLYTMPSILDHIVHAALDPRAFGIRRIILVGEVATPQWQQNMARLFGLQESHITDTYGSIEMGTMAYYSHEAGRYLLAEGIYAEGIGADELGLKLEPLGADERILAVTSFVRRELPALRFVTYDVVRDLRTVTVDGVERQSFQSIVKRVGKELKHGEKISLYDIEQAVYRHVQDAIVRVHVQENALRVHILSKSPLDHAIPAIRSDIRESIPEIGLMIQNRLLDDIEVIAAEQDEPPQRTQVKNKKLYYGAAAKHAEPEEFSTGFLSTIGHTPLVKLGRLFPESGITVYGKLELLNPGGSAKDRPALRMLQEAWKEGRIGRGSVIIESSSGNMANSLAMICRCLELRFISVIDPRTTEANIKIMQALGAEISYVAEPDPATGEFLPARLQRVEQLLRTIPGSYWPNQYANTNNYLAHYHTTMKEIAEQLHRVNYLFCSVSTCGTIRGLAEYVRDHQLATRIVAVDAEGSAIFGGNKEKRRFPGLGAGIVPPFCGPDLADHIVHVSDWEMVESCRALAQKEGILAGPSSGGVLAAVRKLGPQLPPGTVCAGIIHDKGERYLDTVYSDTWVKSQFGRLPGE